MLAVMQRPIDAVLTGAAAPLAGNGGATVPSGIVKQVRHGAVWLSRTGLEGDEQGDRVYHGGPDKALHHYAADHYPRWRTEFPCCPVALEAGAFGENLSTLGMTERDVHVGDVFRAGTALLQATQARQPCFKLNLRLCELDAALRMQASGHTGWYYRVLREGWLAAGDSLELVDRPCPDWPLARLIAALFPAGRAGPEWRAEWERAAALPELAQRWRATFERRLRTGAIEDWAERLYGPAGMR